MLDAIEMAIGLFLIMVAFGLACVVVLGAMIWVIEYFTTRDLERDIRKWQKENLK